MVRSSHDVAVAGSSSGLGTTRELVWPYPGDPRKAWLILCDTEEVVLWHFLEESGLSMEFDLAQTKAKLKEALEQVELIHQAVLVDLPHVAEVRLLFFSVCPQLHGLPLVVSVCLLLALQELEATSIRKSHFLRVEHGQME